MYLTLINAQYEDGETEKGQQIRVEYRKDGDDSAVQSTVVWVPKKLLEHDDGKLRLPDWMVQLKEEEIAQKVGSKTIGIAVECEDDA